MSFPPRGDEFYTHHPQEVYQGEWTNMKAQLGRPTGLALALLATLLATFLAMGAFSVAQAETHPSATRILSATSVLPDGEVMVTINVVGNHDSGVITETWPVEFGFVGVSTNIYSVDSIVRGNRIVVANTTGQVPASFTYTLKAPGEAGGPYTFRGNFAGQVGGEVFSDDILDGEMVTVATAPTNGGNGDGNGEPGTGITLSSQEPGAAVRIEIEANAGAEVTPGEDINIKLASFDLPETMAESHVLFSGAAGSYTGNPSEARISGGDTIILTVPSTLPNGNANPNGVTGRYKVVIKQSAGITNPTAGGMYTVEVGDMDADDEKPEVTNQPRDQAERDQRHSRHDDHRNLQGLRQRIGDGVPERSQPRRSRHRPRCFV